MVEFRFMISQQQSRQFVTVMKICIKITRVFISHTVITLIIWRYMHMKYVVDVVINSLWYSGTIWRQSSVSTLAQEMACSLRAPNHYRNKCWLTSSVKSSGIHVMEELPEPSIIKISLKFTYLKLYSNLLGGNDLNYFYYIWHDKWS